MLVVDDSPFMRRALAAMLERDPEVVVVGMARDGLEAVDLVRLHDPDVVTLDIDMPRMDGLAALRQIMMEMPRPVLMVSSLTSEGAEATLKAMELGAVDFIPKQSSVAALDMARIQDNLLIKVKEVAGRPIRLLNRGPAARKPLAWNGQASDGRLEAAPAARPVVAIGVSTGGPPAVQKVLAALPARIPVSILIAQHMPAAFTGPFAKRLDSLCSIAVKEAEPGEPLEPGTAYIAPGGRHILLERKGGRLEVGVSDEPRDALYKPSASVLFNSVAQCVGGKGMGVVLTGMGSDGLEGARALKAQGGLVLAQSDATCVVYGMPRAVVDAGLADQVVDIDDMAAAILNGMTQ